ncbi:MAG: type 4a pilus biogenesis protein PilO [Ignavibacteriales bacterium]|nr:type 4a pilus biogenesis protein PilO [Ignavibacteriales bacterium]
MDKLLDRIIKAPLGARRSASSPALMVAWSPRSTSSSWGSTSARPSPPPRGSSSGPSRIATGALQNGSSSRRQAIANNLNQFRREKELLEQRLDRGARRAPRAEEPRRAAPGSSRTAPVKAGLEINTIEPASEKPEGFFARIPIPMTVTGNFHEIATFFDSLGRLRRHRQRLRHHAGRPEGREGQGGGERQVPADHLHVPEASRPGRQRQRKEGVTP